jgi:hypothetical protein
MADNSLTIDRNRFLALVLKSPTQMGSLSIINSVTNISRLGTFNKISNYCVQSNLNSYIIWKLKSFQTKVSRKQSSVIELKGICVLFIVPCLSFLRAGLPGIGGVAVDLFAAGHLTTRSHTHHLQIEYRSISLHRERVNYYFRKPIEYFWTKIKKSQFFYKFAT